MMRPYWPATVPEARINVAELALIGLAEVPISSVPPAATVMFPPTSVNVLDTRRLKDKVPLIVVVLAVALDRSTVTVSPARMTTGLQLVGTNPLSHVPALPHPPLPDDVIVEHPTGAQLILFEVSLRSLAS